MIKVNIWLSAAALVLLGLSAQAAVDETWYSIPTSPGSSIKTKSYAATGTSIKEQRRIGLSSNFAGAMGLGGLTLDLNLTKHLSYSIGAGAARGFQSFNMNIKRFYNDGNFMPYFVGGYSRWHSNSGESVDRTSPPFMAKKFLSAKERRSGTFAENIIYPGFGAQHFISSGEWTGFGFFAEVIYLIDLDDLVAAPTAGLGVTYLF